VGALTPVGTADATRRCGDETGSAVRFEAQAGTTYRIAVDSRSATHGYFELYGYGHPANDDFADAVLVPPEGAYGYIPFTGLATKQAGEPDHAGNGGGHSVWYRWTAPASGTTIIDACDVTFDSLVAVYTGTAIDALTAARDLGGYWLADVMIVGPVLVAVIAGLRWLRPTYSVYAIASLLMPLIYVWPNRPLLSMPRFVAVIFPAFWVLARALERRQLPEAALVAAFAGGYALLGALFVTWWDVF